MLDKLATDGRRLLFFQRLFSDLGLGLIFIRVPLHAVEIEALDVLENVVVQVAHQRQPACWGVFDLKFPVLDSYMVLEVILDKRLIELSEFLQVFAN